MINSRRSFSLLSLFSLGCVLGLKAADPAAPTQLDVPVENPADTFSGISGPGEPVQGAGLGGWRSGKDGVRYKGAHPKSTWQLDWDAKKTSSDEVIDLGLLPPIKPLWELHLRDTIITLGGDGLYYMTGSSGDNIWDRTDGIELWRSPDLKQWDYLGLVWSLTKDSTWEKGVHFVWAPEIHYLKKKQTYVMTLCVAGGTSNGTGFLVSSTGKPEGPYVNVFKPDARITGGIDSTVFEDDDGKIYYTWGHADTIFQLKDDFTGFADGPHHLTLDPVSEAKAHALGVRSGVGSEGPSLFKRNGKYYLGGALFIGGVDRKTGRNGRYSSCVAIADHIYGPYSNWEEAVPCGAGGNYFQDKAGDWYCTYFGNDEASPFREKPGMVRIAFESDGRIKIADEQPAFILRDGTPTHWKSKSTSAAATQKSQ